MLYNTFLKQKKGGCKLYSQSELSPVKRLGGTLSG